MKVVVLLFCFLPAALCWEYPGYPGVDCPTALAKMSADPETQWMLPKCQPDGTFQSLQCSDQHPEVPDTCMCCLPDGSPLTLPWYGLNVKSCVCFVQYNSLLPEEDLPKCENNGYFAPLQCNDKTKMCWCVDRNGNVVVPPSTKVHTCDNVAY